MGKAKTTPRGPEYRRALASLPDEDAGTAFACFVFSSLPQKIEAVKALRRIETERGFAGWGTFTRKPDGPATAVRTPRSSSPRAARARR